MYAIPCMCVFHAHVNGFKMHSRIRNMELKMAIHHENTPANAKCVVLANTPSVAKHRATCERNKKKIEQQKITEKQFIRSGFWWSHKMACYRYIQRLAKCQTAKRVRENWNWTRWRETEKERVRKGGGIRKEFEKDRFTSRNLIFSVVQFSMPFIFNFLNFTRFIINKKKHLVAKWTGIGAYVNRSIISN